MKIATFNINGVRARLPSLLNWLKESESDIVLLQEIKCTDESFPKSELEDLGYNVVTHGQKSFNGVAVLSKYPVENIKFGLPGNTDDKQARWIEADINSFHICGLYLPNGNPITEDKFNYKLDWMARLLTKAAELIQTEQKTIICGDFNIIPQKEDAENPDSWNDDALFDLKARSMFRKILNLGFTDALRATTHEAGLYTFWDYQAGSWQKNNGIRIDHILLSPSTADLLISCEIDKYVRAHERPSDHVPIWINLMESYQ